MVVFNGSGHEDYHTWMGRTFDGESHLISHRIVSKPFHTTCHPVQPELLVDPSDIVVVQNITSFTSDLTKSGARRLTPIRSASSRIAPRKSALHRHVPVSPLIRVDPSTYYFWEEIPVMIPTSFVLPSFSLNFLRWFFVKYVNHWFCRVSHRNEVPLYEMISWPTLP